MPTRLLAGFLTAAAALLLAFVAASPAAAAPPGAALNLAVTSQSCLPNGTVSATLQWSPSGLGSQFVQLATDSAFNNRSTGGPYASSADSVGLTQLKAGSTYYARVLTSVGNTSLASDPIAVTARSCTGSDLISRPTNLRTLSTSDGGARLAWTPGDNNVWFCVDTARDLSDLYGLRNSWRNHGCWTTSSSMTIGGLSCDTVYYWLVYAWNASTNVKSDPAIFQTDSCASTISAPRNLDADRVNGGILFDWDAGSGNIWYCVDTALSESDLRNLRNSWRNHGCWTTNTQLLVTDLNCGETYYWLVYAWNHVANTKSVVSTVQTEECEAHLELAPIVDVDVVKSGDDYIAEIVAALPGGCHEPDSHRVRRFGNEIEITVWNSVVPGPCTLIYSEYELNVNLGDDFDSGEEYEVIVNDDESDSFIAD